MILKEEYGQISGEYLLVVGILIAVVMISVSFLSFENELNIAMASAKTGAIEATSSYSIYPEDTYRDYLNQKEELLDLYSVEILNISYLEGGYDDVYDKEKIQFKVYAHNSKDLDKKELDSIGDRINYNLRKSVALSFNTTNAGNKLFNPVFSPHYVYTTANVVWV